MSLYESVKSQVEKSLLERGVTDADEVEILDLYLFRTRYQHSPYLSILDIVLQAHRERYSERPTDISESQFEVERRTMRGLYLNYFTMALIIEAGEAESDEWLRRLRNADMEKLRHKCLKTAALAFLEELS